MTKNLFNTMLLAVAVALLAPFATAHAQTIIPQPQCFEKMQGEFVLSANASVGYTDNTLREAALYLADALRPATGYKLPLKKKGATIVLKLDNSLAKNAYQLTVSAEGVVIVGADYQGVVCGIQSFRQLLPVSIERNSVVADAKWSVAACKITDAPRMNYRGLMLDVSRHFYTPQEVHRLLDLMALYKLNKFHWHLTDDQGWRIEIKRYPKLTEQGAWRNYNSQDKQCMQLAKDKDNDDYLVPTDRMKLVDGENRYGGFYTQREIREIVEYARVRGIDVIPEVDMPGHMLAGIENYKGVSCFDEVGWGKLFSSPVCPGKDTAMEFCKNVYEEVMALFPYEYIHIGGDEVAKDNWKKCHDCQKRIADNGLKNEEELQSWFIHEMEKFINSKGKKMIGWNEIIEGGLSETSTVMWWGAWVKDVPAVTTKHGNDLIFTPNNAFYLDYDESADALKTIYDYDVTAGVDADKQHHVLGVQGNIWCERIPTLNQMFYMTATRALAIAELGWAKTEPKNYHEFASRMIAQLPRLKEMGVNYRIPYLEGFDRTNVFTGVGRYNITCSDPGAVIRYTTDGTIPNASSPLLNGELVLDSDAEIIFRTFHADGKKGDMTKATFLKQTYAPAQDIQPSANGLVCEWHEFPGIDCNKIAEAPLNATFKMNDVDIPEGIGTNRGLITNGYIYVPTDGIYTFTLTSDDGSDLTIDGRMVVDMNKEQSPETTSGQMALAKGYHAIRVRYFDHNGGLLHLVVKNPQGLPISPAELYYTK